MSFFKPKFVLLALASVLLPALWTSGCTGGDFSTEDGAGGSTSTSGGSTSGGDSSQAGAGTGAAAPVKCGGPEDCNDKDNCTTDLCNADGTCDAAPKCAGTEKCCEGDCQECCDASDCDDGVSCTENTCFSGQCMFVPADTACEATQYCSVKDGCRERAACGILVGGDPVAECDDGSTCTGDSCVDNFCKYDFCAEGKLCCEGASPGCAEDCCTDSQCNPDNDPCMVGSCNDGKCSVTPLCADSKQCCPSADGKTATCGSCCSAAECDDRVGCTFDGCGGGQCSHTPTNNCDPGYVCDAVKGCQKASTCMANADCKPSNGCQLNPRCEGGACHFDACGSGTKCCNNAATGASNCARCCDASECSDNIDCTKDTCGASGCSHTPVDTSCAMGQKCDPRQGCVACIKAADCDDGLACTTDTCVGNTCSNVSTCGKLEYCTANGCSTCLSDSDCQGNTTTQGIILPVGCNTSTCVKGQCVTETQDCGDFQICCPPYGCQLTCGIETQDTE